MNIIDKISSLMFVIFLIVISSCENEPFIPLYNIHNDDNDTILIYEDWFYDATDTLKSCDAIKHYRYIKRIIPGESISCRIRLDNIEECGRWSSQIMVFKQQTLTDYTLKEISDNNIYDHLYIYTWKQILEPGFEIRYTSDSLDTE